MSVSLLNQGFTEWWRMLWGGHMTGHVESGHVRPSGQEAAAGSAPSAPATPRRHRSLLGTLFVLATITGIAAVLAVRANRQALKTDNWTNTSSQVLANKQAQSALTAYMVSQLFSSGVVES